MKFLETVFEVIGWLRIVLSPTLAGAIIGAIIYGKITTNTGLAAGIFIAVTGLVVGIIWATRVWKKQGTMRFMSRTMATPELDIKAEPKDNKI